MAENGRRRRLGSLALVALVATAGLVAPTPVAAATTEVTDRAGDAADCRGDLVRSVTKSGGGPQLELTVETACGLGAPNSWPSGTELVWDLDVDGDDRSDWAVRVVAGRYDVSVVAGGSGPAP